MIRLGYLHQWPLELSSEKEQLYNSSKIKWYFRVNCTWLLYSSFLTAQGPFGDIFTQGIHCLGLSPSASIFIYSCTWYLLLFLNINLGKAISLIKLMYLTPRKNPNGENLEDWYIRGRSRSLIWIQKRLKIINNKLLFIVSWL